MATESAFPYTSVPNSLKRLLEKIPTIGAPAKATQQWLAGIGFPGGNDKRNLAVLRAVGIIESDGKPTALWNALRSKDRSAFANGIKKHYADLFATYPDAHKKDDEALVTFVRSKTNYADQAQRLAVRTFKVLTEFGDFDAPTPPEEIAEQPENGHDGGKSEKDAKEPRRRSPARSESPPVALTVNLQLQLPPSADGEVYDKLFAAMAKHLKGLIAVE